MPEIREQAKVLELLAKLANESYKPDEDIVHEGKRIVLPESMPIEGAITMLQQRLLADQQTVEFSRVFDANPYDGAICAWRALKRTFGMVNITGTVGFFGDVEPPSMVSIPTGPGENDREDVPFGTITVPGLPGTTLTFSMQKSDEWGAVFQVSALAPRKYRAQVEGIYVCIADEIRTNSIYRGRAIDGATKPNFLDLSTVDVAKVMYAADVQVQLEANIWTVLRHRKELAEAGITRKRAVLLYGNYGTGKTLCGYQTAQHAVNSGWTFIYVRPGEDDIERCLKVARMYQPACVFVEDLDNVSQDDATSGAVRLLDAFDGITAKGAEVLVVLTTNHPDRLHPGMLRPGRLDAIIEVGQLDAAATANLVRSALPDGALFQDSETGEELIDWDEVHASTDGFMPAYVKEGADRAFRYALARSEGNISAVSITTADLVHAMQGLRPQLALMEQVATKPKVITLDDLVRERVLEGTVLAGRQSSEEDEATLERVRS